MLIFGVAAAEGGGAGHDFLCLRASVGHCLHRGQHNHAPRGLLWLVGGAERDDLHCGVLDQLGFRGNHLVADVPPGVSGVHGLLRLQRHCAGGRLLPL
eukprot:g22961.t1